MIFGVDISSYQGTGIPDNRYGRGAPGFVIINVRDPGMPAKANECIARGTPWAVYTWAFPGADQRDNLRWSALTLEQAGLPWREVCYWIDWEQDGGAIGQIADFHDEASKLGLASGLYTYLFRMPEIPEWLVNARPLWLAYYPGNNDGQYPAGQEGAAIANGAVLWQFSSNAQNQPGLDENVVIDEAWFATWGGGTPPPPTIKETPTVLTVNHGLGKIALTDGGIILADWTEPPYGDYGLPQAYLDWAAAQPAEPFHQTLQSADGSMSDLANILWGEYVTRTKVALGTPVGPPADVDVDDVVKQVNAAWAGASNANEWPTIEAAIRSALA